MNDYVIHSLDWKLGIFPRIPAAVQSFGGEGIYPVTTPLWDFTRNVLFKGAQLTVMPHSIGAGEGNFSVCS